MNDRLTNTKIRGTINMENKIFHLTKAKFQELKKEYDALVAAEHTKAIDEEAPKMVESGDLNPEFVRFQEGMELMRARMDKLEDILKHHQLIKKPPKEKQVFVNLGARVKVEVNGKKDEFVMVGTLEAHPELGKISNESPVGAALMGRKIGEEVVIDSPEKTKYKIKNITYEVS